MAPLIVLSAALLALPAQMHLFQPQFSRPTLLLLLLLLMSLLVGWRAARSDGNNSGSMTDNKAELAKVRVAAAPTGTTPSSRYRVVKRKRAEATALTDTSAGAVQKVRSSVTLRPP
mmetsp:Transcript_18934/g.49332  ORF Transcript_18934/g.49332 Transcript_18934/m.49332 type:complete len:116 (+) Transcript_18934:901-1248(+)